MSAEEDTETRVKRELEEQEERDFELSKQAVVTQRRPSIADEMQAFLKGAARARSNSIDAIEETVKNCKDSAALFDAKSKKLNSGCENLQDELALQEKMLDIIARIRWFAMRKEQLDKLGPQARKLLRWSRRISLREIVENFKIRLQKMEYPLQYSCYNGIDWKTDKKVEEHDQGDSLSALCESRSNQPQASAAAVSNGATGSGNTSVLANAGSTAILASRSSPRV
jgi:hypothetical protein